MSGRFSMMRGTVGVVKPTYRPGSLEEFIRLLPEGIGVIPLYVGIKRGTREEFESVMDVVNERVAQLAEIGVDLIHPEGAPPFMALGAKREAEVVADWEKRHKIPVVTAPQTQVAALRALGVKRMVGLTYFQGELNDMYARYFTEHGFDVAEMAGIAAPFESVGHIPAEEVYRAARDVYLRHRKVDGIYLLGSGWHVLDVAEPLEQDLGVPVVHAVAARVWAIQHRFHVRQPVRGRGRLLADLPPPVQ